MTERIVPPGAQKWGLRLLVAMGGLSLAFAWLSWSEGLTPSVPAVFAVGGGLSWLVAGGIYRRRPAGWGIGLLWTGLFVWIQFWFTTFSDGALGRDLLGVLNLLTVVAVVTLAILVDNTKYYWPPFTDGLSAPAKVGLPGVLVVAFPGSVYFAGVVFGANWRLLGELLITGFGRGSLYALPTIGFVLVYKVTDLLNFAQGIIVVLGAFSVIIFTDWGLPIPAALLMALVLAVTLALVLERVIFRQFIGEPELSLVLVTIALISLIGGTVQAVVGGRLYFGYPDGLLIPSVTLPLGYSLRGSFAVGIVVSLLVLGILVAFFKYTVLGVGLRAAASDQQAAMLLGISISQATKIAWMISITITMVGGILLAMSLGGATFAFEVVLILVFAAAIFGGLDSLIGAYIGSIVIGMLQIIGRFYYPPIYGSGFGEVLPMLFLLGVIVVKPYGLFGTERIERL
jgi:branched-chain amino acid transport system permease protein